MFDLNNSNRNYNELCLWWSRDERDKFTADEYMYKRIPTGSFMAKEVSAQNDSDTIAAGSFMFDKSTITIKSPDNLIGVKPEDLIKFRGEMWIVNNIQKIKSRIQNTAFLREEACSHFWYIELRK